MASATRLHTVHECLLIIDSPTAARTAAPPTTSTCAPHGGLRGEDAARTVAQGAPVPDDHGLAVHCDDAGAYAYTVAPTYALTPAETPFPTPSPTPVPPTPVTTMSMTSTTTTSTTKTEVPTTEAQISCPELKSHGNKVHENREPGHHAATALPRRLRLRRALPAGVQVLREPRVHEAPGLCKHAGRGDRLRQGEPGGRELRGVSIARLHRC